MPQDKGVIKDTVTGLFCTSYNVVLENCQWGNSGDAVEFPTLENAQAAAEDMNGQASQQDRFIGQNPKPR